MKNILLLVLLTAGYQAISQNDGAAPQRVGYADIEYIISQLPEMKEIRADMQSTQTQLRNQIQERSKQVEQQYQNFNATMESMTDTVRATRQRELEEAVAGLEQMQMDAQQTLQNKQKLYMAPLYLKVNKVIQDVAKENGYSVILTEGVGEYNLLLYKNDQYNISPLVLEALGVTPAPKENK